MRWQERLHPQAVSGSGTRGATRARNSSRPLSSRERFRRSIPRIGTRCKLPGASTRAPRGMVLQGVPSLGVVKRSYLFKGVPQYVSAHHDYAEGAPT
jgi:hypothetical protein